MRKAVITYSIIWFACTCLLYSIFAVNEKSFIWTPDGLYQHFSAFNCVCNSVESILAGQGMATYDFGLGQGGDVFQILGSYDYCDPISWLVAALPFSRLIRYYVMLTVKLYLVGLSFIVCCWAMEHKEFVPIVCGAVAYCFSGMIIGVFSRHPNFINWAYCLPLIIGGIERYLRCRKAGLLVGGIFLNAITSFYSLYMNVIISVIYVVLRALKNVAVERTSEALKRELLNGLSIAGFYVVGLLLAAFILVPVMYGYSINARIMSSSGYSDSLLHYKWSFYGSLIESVFGASGARNWSLIGLNAFLFVPIIALFCNKGNTTTKLMIVVLAMMLCIPFFGRLMNGFGYASNRFAYALAFFGSIAIVEVFRIIESPTRKERIAVLAALALFAGFYIFDSSGKPEVLKWSSLAIVVFMCLSWEVVTHFGAEKTSAFILVLVVVGASYQVVFKFSPDYKNEVGKYIGDSGISKIVYGNSSVAAKDLADGFYRVEAYERRANMTSMNGVYGTGMWWSVIPSYITDYYNYSDVDSVVQNCNFKGLDARTGLLELASVRYYTQRDNKNTLVPAGYKRVDSPLAGYRVYENEYALPIGYTYEHTISSKSLDGLNGIQREMAMLQGAVIEGDPTEIAPIKPNVGLLDIPYAIKAHDGVKVSDTELKWGKAKGKLKLSARLPEGYETFFFMDSPTLKKKSKVDITVDRVGSEFNSTTSTRLNGKMNKWPIARNGIAYNLGSGDGSENEITVSPSGKCTIGIEALHIYAVAEDDYLGYAAKLKECVLEDVSVGNNAVSGTIDAPNKRFLQLSIPYSIGWKAYVDGEEIEVYRSSGMYMGFPVEKGNHDVRLLYQTPYLIEGAIVSLVTLLAILICIALRKQRKSVNDAAIAETRAGDC